MPKPGMPRFNHVAMSVPASLLEPDGRKDLLDFWGSVFGWQELPTETVDGQKLVMMAYSFDQFIFLIADDPPMACPRLDHFGMGVATKQELDEYYDRVRDYAKRDERVDVIERKAEEYPGLTLSSFYVKFLLPLMLEVQHFDWSPAS
ncbi:MAG TPA: hypothetical protein VNY84_12320 [Acidimicrobiales bacterium]|nr:hypothetical protein [Acidimicrobiales bacterium]